MPGREDRSRSGIGRCARCGACVPVCPVFASDGRESSTARGKLYLLSLDLAGAPSSRFREIFSRCLLCGRCERVCSRGLDITTVLRRARARFPVLSGPRPLTRYLAREILASPALLRQLVRAGIRLNRLHLLPRDSGLRLRLGLVEPPVRPDPRSGPGAIQEGQDLYWFSGCLARYLQPGVGQALRRILSVRDLQAGSPPEQRCCGLAAASAGQTDQARQLAWRNIQAFAATRGPILTTCSSCSTQLRTYPDLFADDPDRLRMAREFSGRVIDFCTLVNDLDLPWVRGESCRVLFHEPCHMEAVEHRQCARLLDQVPGLDRVEAAGGGQCCGQGGLFHLGYPELSARIFARCADSSMAVSPALVTTTCSGCLLQWQLQAASRGLKVRVQHLAQVLAEQLAPEQ